MQITRGNYTLSHETYLDDYGFLRDRLELVETLSNGDYINYPILPRMKVKNYFKDENIFDSTQGYNESDLTIMLEDTIKELQAVLSKIEEIENK